jgi:hypothetical protein
LGAGLRMRRAVTWLLATGLICVAVTASQGASTTYTHGYDISWPQCSNHGKGSAAAAKPASSVHYVVLGLTHGAGHTANPCLAAQLAWARSHRVPVGAYLVPSYPTTHELAAASSGPYGACAASDKSCRLANDGVAQADDAIAEMRRAGVPAPMVWVDVEFRHVHPWSHSRSDNARVVSGVFTGLALARVPYGVYTTSYMWKHIVGGMRANVPNWLPAGSGKSAGARAECRVSATGGATWITQYTRHFDEDLTCPVMDATPGKHGPMWRYRDSVLEVGSRGTAVRLAQQALGKPANPTGSFDARTFAAVVGFQTSHQLPVDGRIDNDDWRALGAYKLYGGHGFLLSKVAARVS